ncbi:MAG: hypothetical protein Q4D98_09615 [Planctomycetia bacterium]|nr:hypothetical protein [Planctomycetia bacterium]
METHYILGIHTRNRISQASQVQSLLTEYGCNIRTRLGLHRVADGVCALDGVILLELFGDTATCDELFDKLSAVEGVDVQKMVFTG